VAISKDPAKATLTWFRRKQWIKHGLAEEKPPKVYQDRISKTVAFIYRGLVQAAENREIFLEKGSIADFMINNLKGKYGDDVKKDSLTITDKRRQNQTK
jgi:hypothetical protein